MHGPIIILTKCAQSHPFEERRCYVGGQQDPLKIGRSVARLKPIETNAIFDCKVLSRNHAILWYEDGNFFLKDTKSSNGTFVNSERLTVNGETSEAKQLYSGDIIQFGVEIVENTNKVAHGCIFAVVKLFNENGDEVERPGGTICNRAGEEGISVISSQQLFQLQQFLKETMLREKSREDKLTQLENLLDSTERACETSWKAFVNEDRLLTRIAALEEQLNLYQKNAHTDKVKLEMEKLLEDKAKYHTITSEALTKAKEEKAEAQRELDDTMRSLMSTEEECSILREKVQDLENRLETMIDALEEIRHSNEKDRLSSREDTMKSLIDLLRAEGDASNHEHPDQFIDEVKDIIIQRYERDRQVRVSEMPKEDSPEDNLVSVVENNINMHNSNVNGVVYGEAGVGNSRVHSEDSSSNVTESNLVRTNQELQQRVYTLERELEWRREARGGDEESTLVPSQENSPILLLSFVPFLATLILLFDSIVSRVMRRFKKD